VSLVIFGLINMLVAWILLFAGIVLLLVVEYAIRRNSTFRSLLWAWIPGLVALVSLIFFLPFVGSRIASMNPWLALQRATQVSAPGEVALNATTSWHLAKTLVKEHPAFGTGVGTWVYGYARLRDAALNLSPFWDASFDQGSSTFFTLLGTIGIVGILALFLALVWMIIASVRACAHARKEQGHEKEGVFIAGLLLIAALFFVNLPFTSIFGVWFLLVICLGTGRHRVFHWGEKEEAGHYAGYYTRPVLLGFAILVGFLLIWGAGQRALAESQLVKAQQLGNAGAVSQAVESAMRSHAWNPLDDTSLRMLSKLFLFQGSTKLNAVQGSQDLLAGRTLVEQAVSLATRAREKSPASIENWLQEASAAHTLANLDPTKDEQELAALRQALILAPTNPVTPYELAVLYMSRADREQKWIASKDAEIAKAAQIRQSGDFALARAHLEQSLRLKSDFWPAQYEMALLLTREKKLGAAIKALEGVWNQDQTNRNVGMDLAILYHQAQELPKTINLLEFLISRDGNDREVRLFLSRVYEEVNRREDAIAHLQTLVALWPDNPAVKDRLAMLIKQADAARASIIAPVTSTQPVAPVKKKTRVRK
jgi:tetratricopeptide (TPR) repeat protein